MDLKNLSNLFTFKGNLNKKNFWKNFFEKLLILILSNIFLSSLISFDGETDRYYIGTISQFKEISFRNYYLFEVFQLLSIISFILFSIYLLSICRRRVRDMGSDSLVALIFATPLIIISGIYLYFATETSIDFFVYFYLGKFNYLKDVYSEFLLLIFFIIITLTMTIKLKD